MKKYLPFLIFISVSSLFLMLQVANKRFGLSANSLNTSEKKIAFYSSIYKKKSFKFGDNTTKKLKDFKTKVIIVNFWASWCIPCLEEMPTLINLQKKYKEVTIVYIDVDEKKSLKNAKKLVKKFNIASSQVVYDTSSKISELLKLNSVPFTIVFVNGKAKDLYEGANDFSSASFIEKFNFKKK